MKKNNSRLLLIIVTISVFGFVIGYCVKSRFLSEANAEAEDTLGVNEESVDGLKEFDNVFPDDTYNVRQNIETSAYHITYKNSKAKSTQTLYTKSDTLDIVEEILKSDYDILVMNESDYDIMYQEFQNGYPTGAYASFVFDEEGYLLEAYCRKGSIYDFDESTMISYDRAYDLAIDAIARKYGDSIELQGTMSDYNYELRCDFRTEQMCYYIQEILGYKQDNTDIMEVRFYVLVSGDGEYVEVASTLRY